MRKDPQALRFCLASNAKAEKEIKEGGNKEGVGLGAVGVRYHLQSGLC